MAEETNGGSAGLLLMVNGQMVSGGGVGSEVLGDGRKKKRDKSDGEFRQRLIKKFSAKTQVSCLLVVTQIVVVLLKVLLCQGIAALLGTADSCCHSHGGNLATNPAVSKEHPTASCCFHTSSVLHLFIKCTTPVSSASPTHTPLLLPTSYPKQRRVNTHTCRPAGV